MLKNINFNFKTWEIMTKPNACLVMSAGLILRHKQQPFHWFNNLRLPLADLIHSQGVSLPSRLTLRMVDPEEVISRTNSFTGDYHISAQEKTNGF